MSSQNRGCLAALLGLFERLSAPEPMPYRLRDDFLSPVEFSFYKVLCSVVQARATVFPKVRLADVLFVAQGRNYYRHFNRISAKHIDFLVCEPVTLRPLFAIELDDSSHSRSDREARDAFVDEAFGAAGLPLLRFPSQREYNGREIAAQVEPLLKTAPAPSTAPAAPSPGDSIPEATSAPLCPKCGVPMVVRVAAYGRYRGTRFYGCPNYPRCRETRPLSPEPSGDS